MHRVRLISFAALACFSLAPLLPAAAADTQVDRGKYLVTLGGCADCHTPRTVTGRPDMTRFLAGSDVGFALPGLGVFVPPNLTPDKETGLGDWSRQQIVTALTKGQLPDGRILAPIMPWRDFAKLSKEDADSIAAYLQSLTPVKHQIPGPFGPQEKVSVSVQAVLTAAAYNSLPQQESK